MPTLPFTPLSAFGQDRAPDDTLKVSELLARAKAAIKQAREQVQRTQTLIAEFNETQDPDVALGRGSTRY